MSCSSFIGLVDNAEDCNVTKHKRQGGERHCQWKKGARLTHNGAERIGTSIHFCVLELGRCAHKVPTKPRWPMCEGCPGWFEEGSQTLRHSALSRHADISA